MSLLDALRVALEQGEARALVAAYADGAVLDASLVGRRERLEGREAVVGLVLYGWILGHSAVVHPDPAETGWAFEELGWWAPLARRGLERLHTTIEKETT